MIKFKMKSHFVSDNKYNIVNIQCRKLSYKELWQPMLASHLVLVTLHGRFTIDIELDE
jgi:hypothetical protein